MVLDPDTFIDIFYTQFSDYQKQLAKSICHIAFPAHSTHKYNTYEILVAMNVTESTFRKVILPTLDCNYQSWYSVEDAFLIIKALNELSTEQRVQEQLIIKKGMAATSKSDLIVQQQTE
jgi:hypothetical protein